MNKDWILQTKETRRLFSNSTWIPLRAAQDKGQGNQLNIGYFNEFFGCGSVAFMPSYRTQADNLGWDDIGLNSIGPHAYEDGTYSPIDEYRYADGEPVGLHLVLELPQPVTGGVQWLLNPDIVAALRLIKEDCNWVRPEENFDIVAREIINEKGEHKLIEIKREYLIDYLAARNLALRLSYYRQRVENVSSIISSQYEALEDHDIERDNGRYALRISELNDVFGGSWAMFRTWRTDVDEDDDAPVMGPETNQNTDYESSRGIRGGLKGVRVEGEFWRDEWIDHQGNSTRTRGDLDKNLPQFIIETDGARLPSLELKSEEVGRWLWFRSSIINELLSLRGFSLKWYTSETGSIISTSGYSIHFGINQSDLITVYAYDIARLRSWEQQIWAAHNVVPDGKVSTELFLSQVKCEPASTYAVEILFFDMMTLLEESFNEHFKIPLFTHSINRDEALKLILRFNSRDLASLLRLAKDIIRYFSDRLDVRELRKISTHANKANLGSNKLLEDVLAQSVGSEKAREVFGPIAGAYDMRLGDAHPTSSKISEALGLAGIDKDISSLRQGEQLIHNVGHSIWSIGNLLFGKQ